MLTATFSRGDHEQLTCVHRIPPVPGQTGHSDYDPAVCGVVAAHRRWAPLSTPPAAWRAPLAHRCPECFKGVS